MDKRREACASILRWIGVPEEIINIPVVFESCFKDYCKKNGQKGIKSAEKIGDEVKFEFGGVKYSVCGNTFKKTYDEDSSLGNNFNRITITQDFNKYGIAKSLNYESYGFGALDFGTTHKYTLERKKGIITKTDETKNEKRFLDSGSIDLESLVLVPIKKTSNKKTSKKFEEALGKFDEVSEEAIANYPELKEYYEKLRTYVVKKLDELGYQKESKSDGVEQSSELDLSDKDSKREILQLQEQLSQAKREILQLQEQLSEGNNVNKKLEESNRQLTAKLNTTMQLCEAVKRSKYRNIFFGRKKLNFTQDPYER